LEPLFASNAPLSALALPGAQALLRDMGFALAALLAAERDRVVITTEASADLGGWKAAVWEVGLERDGADVLVSVFTPGTAPRIGQTEHRAALVVAARAVLDGIERVRVLSERPQPGRVAHLADAIASPVEIDGVRPRNTGLAIARDQLLSSLAAQIATEPRATSTLKLRSKDEHSLVLSTEIQLRAPRSRGGGSELSRADLHALLFRGELRAQVGDSERRIANCHVFLVAEQLLELAAAGLDAAQHNRGMLRRAHAGTVSCGVQIDRRSRVTLLLADAAQNTGPARGWRLPAIGVDEFTRAVVSFGRELSRQLVRHDKRHNHNLRLSAFRDRLRRLVDELGACRSRRSLLNHAPESYRAFAESAPPPPAISDGAGTTVARLRFRESWRAVVPGIDLRATRLCGDRLIVGSLRELACIERSSGALIWRQPSRRGASIMTPVGLARLSADGSLAIHDYGDGETTLELTLEPAVGGGVSGAVINAPGLPHMLLVGEGARYLAAVDLDSGEIRWRRTLRRGGRLRLRRAGKLVVVARGEAQLVALDLLTGEEVWRHVAADAAGRTRRGGPTRLRYVHGPVLDRGSLFVTCTEPGIQGPAQLEHIDPWTGAVRWRAQLPGDVSRLSAPLCSPDAVVIVGRSDGRSGLWIFNRKDGSLRFDGGGVLGPAAVATIAVDDLVVANSDAGELMAVSIDDGAIRYRHVFAHAAGGVDRPHSIQPVLRSGALFVPHSELYVVRPRDGALVGRVPSELVPDLVRVDERCGVYVAELSGHLAGYHAQPALALVTPIE